MVLQKFNFTKCLSVAIPAKVNGGAVVNIVDTGSAGVIISEGCFKRLGLIKDVKVEYIIA